MEILPIRKDVEEDQVGDYTKPYEFSNVPLSDIRLVFTCEDCDRKKTDDVSNVTYNGAPMCCNIEMMLSHGEVKI